MTPFILFFGLTVATAVIAYWSDNLGKKLGKKRVSLWGLRPRTTATLLTVVTSWGILWATIIVLLIVVEPLKSALFRFDSERASNRRLLASTEELQKQTGQLLKQQDSLVRSNEDLKEKNERARQQLNSARTNVKKANASAKKANLTAEKANARAQQAESARVAATRAEAQAQKSRIKAQKREVIARQGESLAEKRAEIAKQNLQVARTQLDATRTRLAGMRARLANTETSLQAANTRLANAQTRLERAQSQLETAQKKLANAQVLTKDAKAKAEAAYKQAADAFKQAADAFKQVAAARQQVETIQAERQKLQENIDTLEVRYERLYGVATALDQQANALDQQFDLATSANVQVAFGQNLASGLIDTNHSLLQIQADLADLLRQGRAEVARQNEKATVTLSPLVIGNEQRAVVIPSKDVIATLAEFISNRGQVSVRLVADRNVSAKENDVTARFVSVEVRPVLSAGSVLAEANIDGRLSDAKVFNALLDLVDKGRDVASKKGVNPPVSRQQPFFVEGTNELIFEALRQIRENNGPVRVQMLAAAPLTTVDPPTIRFELEAVKSQQKL